MDLPAREGWLTHLRGYEKNELNEESPRLPQTILSIFCSRLPAMCIATVAVPKCSSPGCIFDTREDDPRCWRCRALAGEDAAWRYFSSPRNSIGEHFTDPDTEELVTAQQAAERLNCTVTRVYEAIKSGTLERADDGWAVRISVPDLRDFIERQQQPR